MIKSPTTFVFTIIAAIFSCVLIASSQASPKDKTKANTQVIPAEEKGKENDEKDLDDLSTFDFSLPGDNRIQNLDLFFELPFNSLCFEFKNIEGKLSGNYFLTFEKPPDPPKNLSLWKSIQREYSKMEAISESFTLHLEVSTTSKLGVGGYIEIEGDMSIETDPRLHTTFYGEYNPWRFVEVAFGGWTEIQRLGKESLENGRLRSGLRTHCNIELEFKWIEFSIMTEYLPHWDFQSYRLNTSPEVEFKFDKIKIPFKKDNLSFSLVFHGEIDYYSENKDFTVDPLFEINPWEIRWTQLVRHRF